MEMHEGMPWMPIALSGVAGFLAGLASFSGLWWTTRRMAAGNMPWLLLGGGFLLRLGVVIGVFWFVARGSAPSLLAALAGFLAARQVMIRKVRRSVENPAGRKKGTHAHQPG